MSKSNLKLQVFGLFSRFVGTLIIKISSSGEPANSRSIHRVRNGGKLVILFHPSPKNITERCRSLSWKPAKARWKYQNGAERAEQIFLAHAQQNAPLLGRWQGNTHTQMSSFSVACRGHTARHCTKASRGLVDMKPRKQIIFNTRFWAQNQTGEVEVKRRSWKQTKRSSTKRSELQRIRERRGGKSCLIWVFSNAKAQKNSNLF